MGKIRWVVCALLFCATTINYIDRQVLGILAPDLQRSIGWSEVQYGYIVTSFQAAYALGLLLAGRILDRVGTKRGFTVAIVVWSLAAMAHALARSAFGFGVARFVLGLGESANFPASIKTVAEWFPRKERAFATGLFNAGSNLGAIVAPAVVPIITLAYGWPWAFVLTGAIGFVWLFAWLGLYATPEEHPRLSPKERAHIRSDDEEPSTP
ncbi:MAG: MFS transporter, partial [Vicinamibacteria bacterium]